MGDATAVICYNDEIAHLLIQKLLEQGLRVPEDVAVASFDNSFYSQVGPRPHYLSGSQIKPHRENCRRYGAGVAGGQASPFRLPGMGAEDPRQRLIWQPFSAPEKEKRLPGISAG